MTPIFILEPILRLLIFSTVLLLLFFERSRGLRVSAAQFCLFCLYVLSSTFPFFSWIKNLASDDPALFPAVTFFVTLCMILVSFFAHFFVEKKPAYSGPTTPPETSKPCPEMSASFPSQLAFSWFTGMAWTGFRRTLVASDLWDPLPIISSRIVVPK